MGEHHWRGDTDGDGVEIGAVDDGALVSAVTGLGEETQPEQDAVTAAEQWEPWDGTGARDVDPQAANPWRQETA